MAMDVDGLDGDWPGVVGAFNEGFVGNCGHVIFGDMVVNKGFSVELQHGHIRLVYARARSGRGSWLETSFP